MASCIRRDIDRKSSPGSGWMAGPNRTDTGYRPFIGHDRPRGIAANVPRRTMGTTGIEYWRLRLAAPCRHRPTQPSRDRVPSGNTRRFHPSSTSLLAVTVARFPPVRSMGKVLNTRAVVAARHHTSKK
jgi:hypothetical protein